MKYIGKYLPEYTYEDYKEWKGDWELIEGIPYAMSRASKREHQYLAKKILIQLEEELENCKKCETYYELDWIISERTTIRPDLMVVCGDFEEDFLEFPPSIVFEVLSKSTALKDRNIKSKIYQAHNVKYYCLVNPQNQMIEVFELKNEVYQLVLETSTENFIFSVHNCKAEIDFSKIWKRKKGA